MLDSTLAARLVDILKIESPSLQTKVASILEYWSMIEQCVDVILATEIESALINFFTQKVQRGMESNFSLYKEPTPSITRNMSTSYLWFMVS